MKNKRMFLLLTFFVSSLFKVQAMQGLKEYFPRLAMIAFGVGCYIYKPQSERWFDKLVAERREPEGLTLQERDAIEKRFSSSKKYEVFFTGRKDGFIGVIHNSQGKILVSLSPTYLQLSEEMKRGIRAHEAAHVECNHQVEREEKESKLQKLAILVQVALFFKNKKWFGGMLIPLAGAYYLAPAYYSRLQEKEADLYNKTPEELYGLLMFFYVSSCQMKEDNWFQKLKSPHPSDQERMNYIREAFKKQTRDPGSRDIPLTQEALDEALCVYLKRNEVDHLLKAHDFDATWQELKITHTPHIKERIFFLWKEYVRRYLRVVAE